jgi:hypothetical protein
MLFGATYSMTAAVRDSRAGSARAKMTKIIITPTLEAGRTRAS